MTTYAIAYNPTAEPGVPVYLPISDLAQTLTYDGSNNITSIQVSYQSFTFTQTFTYTGSNVTAISPWTVS